MAVKKRNGFERLRGVAAMALMGVGGLMGGSARAASRAMPVTVTQISFGIVTWSDIQTRPMFSGNTVVTSHGLHLGSTTKTGTLTHIHSERAFGLGSAAYSKHVNAFDNVLNLVVGGHPFVNPDATVDLSGTTTLTTDTQVNVIPHINATVQYWFDPIRPVARALYTLTNTSASAVTTDLLVAGNLGSNLNTTVEATQSGNHTIDATDRWYVTSDNGLGGPLVTTTRYGSGASVIPTNALTPGSGARKDNYGLRYHVTVPANGTVRVLVFHELGNPATVGVADALAASAADFESLDSLDSAGLLNGITAAQRAQIVNYGSGSGGGGGGTLGLLGLAALGLAAARRRRTDPA
jgi:MYXO-CTERM domain-containing protein